jgi:hypothetical protein
MPIPDGWGTGGVLAGEVWAVATESAAAGETGAMARMNRQNIVIAERKT